MATEPMPHDDYHLDAEEIIAACKRDAAGSWPAHVAKLEQAIRRVVAQHNEAVSTT